MPTRLTAHDFDQELLILFDAYVHGSLNRRGFLAQAQKFAKAGVTAAGLLAALSPDFAAGQQVPADDARLKIERLSQWLPGAPRRGGQRQTAGRAGDSRKPRTQPAH